MNRKPCSSKEHSTHDTRRCRRKTEKGKTDCFEEARRISRYYPSRGCFGCFAAALAAKSALICCFLSSQFFFLISSSESRFGGGAGGGAGGGGGARRREDRRLNVGIWKLAFPSSFPHVSRTFPTSPIIEKSLSEVTEWVARTSARSSTFTSPNSATSK